MTQESKGIFISLKDNAKAIAAFNALYSHGTVSPTSKIGRDNDNAATATISEKEVYELTDGFMDPAAFKIFRLFAAGQTTLGKKITAADLAQFHPDSEGRVFLNQEQLNLLISNNKNLIHKDSNKGISFYDFNAPPAVTYILVSSC
ncbi:hypothetical protein [Gallibacterium anatis]|uniref:hypothetical protein n=1 Tax=Gallibacterium anatis TaxID=750 RepID=UPI00080269A0|nr:hypothetical protein [Gallibacterium anatis]OBW95830.1 hypothetical protein QV02_04885 [Gallibacterium anatis]